MWQNEVDQREKDGYYDDPNKVDGSDLFGMNDDDEDIFVHPDALAAGQDESIARKKKSIEEQYKI